MSDVILTRDAMVRDHCGDDFSLTEIRQHFERDNSPELLPLKRPCHDCAVVDGMYAPVSACLSLMPPEFIARRSKQWWCHNNPGRACAGNIEFQARVRGALAQTGEA